MRKVQERGKCGEFKKKIVKNLEKETPTFLFLAIGILNFLFKKYISVFLS